MATDPQLKRTLIDSLSQEDIEVMHEANGGHRVANILDMNPEVIVISEDSPVLGGLEHLALVRRVTSAPIIFVGKEEEIQVISALVNGADMYVRTPVNRRELASRVRALGRRAGSKLELRKSKSNSSASLDDLPHNIRMSLTDTESRLLSCLMERCGDVIEHDELMKEVWGKTVDKERLRFYIHCLRRKLKEVVHLSLHTRIGVGYRLVTAGDLQSENVRS